MLHNDNSNSFNLYNAAELVSINRNRIESILFYTGDIRTSLPESPDLALKIAAPSRLSIYPPWPRVSEDACAPYWIIHRSQEFYCIESKVSTSKCFNWNPTGPCTGHLTILVIFSLFMFKSLINLKLELNLSWSESCCQWISAFNLFWRRGPI